MSNLHVNNRKISVQYDCEGIDWASVVELLTSVGMRSYAPADHKRAFEASHSVVFLFDADKLVGFGRAISDGVYQAALYDFAISVKYQGLGLGKYLLEAILGRVGHCNVILYAAPGKESFYAKSGFRRMKTGMALFMDADQKLAAGFIE